MQAPLCTARSALREVPLTRLCPSRPAVSLLLASAAALGTGCGDDLFGGPALDAILGVDTPPRVAAWEMRWFVGPGEGWVVDCELRTTPDLSSQEVLFGEMSAGAPDVSSPGWTFDEQGKVAVGMAVLVDVERYRPFTGYPPLPEVDEDEEEWIPAHEEYSTWLGSDLDRGVWGMGREHVVVVMQPGGEDAALSLMVGDELPPELADGPHWMEVVLDLVGITGGFEDALFPFPPEARTQDTGIWVTALEHIDDFTVYYHTGELVGGIRPGESCE